VERVLPAMQMIDPPGEGYRLPAGWSSRYYRPDAPFSITLSSWSSREAAALLDGIRQGQPLGALLGYRFERSLHEARLDRFVGTARDLAPLVAGRLVPPPASQESVSTLLILDDLVMISCPAVVFVDR